MPPADPRSVSPERRFPAPMLAPSKQLAWQIEQHGRPVAAKGHTVELARAPFSLVVHVRAGITDLFVNASFKSQTFDAARLGWPFAALKGIQGASRIDLSYEEPPAANNRQRDLFVDEHAPNQWIVCPPGSPTCDGFDEPCESTAEGAICRRTIERLQVFSRDKDSMTLEPRRDISSTSEKKLYIVFVVPGRWSEDERAGKMPYQSPERARDWVMVLWKTPP